MGPCSNNCFNHTQHIKSNDGVLTPLTLVAPNSCALCSFRALSKTFSEYDLNAFPTVSEFKKEVAEMIEQLSAKHFQ